MNETITWTSAQQRHRAQDFARCAGNPCRQECETCARNVRNSPVHPEATRQVWMGVWVMENERCPSRVAMEVKQ